MLKRLFKYQHERERNVTLNERTKYVLGRFIMNLLVNHYLKIGLIF